ncbi:hypothetical protein B0T24DRAFT_607734 [Lasiosphaeria ovina]|uniref:Uncharacterized protein n=1 Tax=Lasiosphaeria ovina TaxID=92902 RepID=A0AAE0TYN0_9PEZI|nr:hypothetical protein B0T24DRAFT_607734 [Lasiosphaeria ovina]
MRTPFRVVILSKNKAFIKQYPGGITSTSYFALVYLSTYLLSLFQSGDFFFSLRCLFLFFMKLTNCLPGWLWPRVGKGEKNGTAGWLTKMDNSVFPFLFFLSTVAMCLA